MIRTTKRNIIKMRVGRDRVKRGLSSVLLGGYNNIDAVWHDLQIKKFGGMVGYEKMRRKYEKLLLGKRRLLIEKINEEFEEFKGDLGYYDGKCQYNIIISSEYISAMIYAYDYINKAIFDSNLIDDDQVDYLLKLENPLDKISDIYVAMIDGMARERNELFNKAIQKVVKEGE